MTWLKTTILARPKLALFAGQALFGLGGLLVVCGLAGRAARTAIDSARGISKQAPLNALSEAYPGFPLWWVPESPLGYVFPALLALAGIYVALTAKQCIKLQKRGFGSRYSGVREQPVQRRRSR